MYCRERLGAMNTRQTVAAHGSRRMRRLTKGSVWPLRCRFEEMTRAGATAAGTQMRKRIR